MIRTGKWEVLSHLHWTACVAFCASHHGMGTFSSINLFDIGLFINYALHC